MKLGLTVLSLLFVFVSCKDNDDRPDGGDIPACLSWLRKRDREDITKYSLVAHFLAHHHVYISLTTSPTRIKFVTTMLKTLDTSNVTAIVVNLPKVFARTNSSYTIPPELTSFPKVVINRVPKDLGPITKLIPGLEFTRTHDPKGEDLVITVDDDIGYPWGAINEIIKNLVFSSSTVVGGSTEPLAKWQLDPSLWPNNPEDAVIEGYGAIGYRVKDIDPAPMLEIAAAMITEKNDKACFLSDDLVISYVLGRTGIRLQRLNSDYHSRSQLIPFDYGKQDDALHTGAGEIRKIPGFGAGGPDGNSDKYERCLQFMSTRFRHPEH
jgi:hypothetical protein